MSKKFSLFLGGGEVEVLVGLPSGASNLAPLFLLTRGAPPLFGLLDEDAEVTFPRFIAS